LQGNLSPGTYSALIGSVIQRDFAAVTPATGVSVTIAGTLNNYTVTRAAGSYLTDGFKIGDVIRLTVGALNALNINKNLMITALSATVATVRAVNGSALAAEGPIAGTTITVFGKKTLAPLSGHTSDYYTQEDWQPDIAQSELFTDVVYGMLDFDFKSNGNATLTVSGPGINRTTGTAQVLTTPTAETSSQVMAGVSGLLLVNGVAQAVVTSMTLKINNGAASMPAVLGSTFAPDISRHITTIDGSFNYLWQDGVIPALFENGTKFQLVFIITTDNTATADFMCFSLSKVQLDQDTKDSGREIQRSGTISAEINGSGGTALSFDKTIISIQDSLA
jgi:hypothetical protein